MGIFCQIYLSKPYGQTFRPGETILGAIKYALSEPMEFEKITTSLKGNGELRVADETHPRNKTITHAACETYVDIDDVVLKEKTKVAVGYHEIKFNFKIPENVPSSLDFKKHIEGYKVRCKIKYYIRIKFDRPGWFTFAKHFKKEINVVTGFTPQLLTNPIIYGEQKKLMRLFSRKNAVVNVKATILNSVVPIGGKIQVSYELKNDTNVIIKSVETKLVEVYTFRPSGHPEIKSFDDVPYTEYKTGSINCDVSQSVPLEMDMPIDRVSLQYSKLVSRDYIVKFTAELPMPHRNVVLDIPVQIGRMFDVPESSSGQVPTAPANYEDLPPSYWEVMGETVKSDKFEDEHYCGDFENGERSNSA